MTKNLPRHARQESSSSTLQILDLLSASPRTHAFTCVGTFGLNSLEWALRTKIGPSKQSRPLGWLQVVPRP